MASYESKKITVSINTAINIGKKTWGRFAMTPNALFQFSLKWVLLGGTKYRHLKVTQISVTKVKSHQHK